MLSAGTVFLIYRAIRVAFRLYEFILLARILLTWTNISPYNSKIARFLCDLTDPFLGKIEQYMPQALLAPLNFSPIVAFLILSVAESILYRLLLLLM